MGEERCQKQDWWFRTWSRVVTICVNYLEALPASVNVKVFFFFFNRVSLTAGLAWLLAHFLEARKLYEEFNLMIQCEMMYWWGIFHFLTSARTNRAKVFPFRTAPDRKVADARWTWQSWCSSQLHLATKWNKRSCAPRLLIYFSSLSTVFSRGDSLKTWSYNHGFLWSHLTIILDTKSTALTGTGCQIKPFNDKFSPKVSWEISSGLHCGKRLWTWHWT